MHDVLDKRGHMQDTQREIRNVALLDLTGATSEQTLDGVGRIVNVATILVPEKLLGKLMAIPMRNVAATVPVPDGKTVRVMSGQVTLSGEALAYADGPQDQVLVVAGQLIIQWVFSGRRGCATTNWSAKRFGIAWLMKRWRVVQARHRRRRPGASLRWPGWSQLSRASESGRV
jgi:hypothetical protein